MFIPLCVAALLFLALGLGGDLTRLGRLRFRLIWLPVAALVVQVVIIEVVAASLPEWADKSLHIATYAMIAVFLWRNRRVPGLALLGAGALTNGLTILVNGGQLPVNAHALRESGLVRKAGEFHNTGTFAHPHLAFLGDTLVTPAFLPFRTVISVGDVLIMLGAAWLVLAVCGTRWSRAYVPKQAPSRWLAGRARPAEVPAPRSALAEAHAVVAPERVVVDESPADTAVA